MEKPQGEWATDADQFQKPPSEYRFVYNRAATKKEARGNIVGFLLVLIVPTIPFLFGGKNRPFDWYQFAFLFLATLLGLLFIFFRRPRIVLNQDGMTCEGFLFQDVPHFCAWREISLVRKTPLSTGLFKSSMPQRLVFVRHTGKPFFLDMGSRETASFVGVGHLLSLEEALAHFVGHIEELNDEEKKKYSVRALAFDGAATEELGKELKHVAYLALGIAVIATILTFLPNAPHLLDNAISPFISWPVGVIITLLAGWYMRHIKKKGFLILALFLGGVVTFLLFPPTSVRLLAWLGTEERVVFAISAEDSSEQRWTATTNAEQTFAIHTQPDNRTHKGVGTEQTMLLYRGPGSLNALASQEYRALFIEDPSERNRRGKRE